MSAHMPSPFQPHDPELDRALALARTPQVPDDLAARILRDVTRLPQEPIPLRPAEPAVQPTRRNPRPWLRAAGFAALTLLTGAAAAMLLHNTPDDEQPGQQLATVERSAPAITPLASGAATSATASQPASAGLVAPASRSDGTGEAAVKPAPADGKIPATQPAPAQLASETAAPVPVVKPTGMAQNGPIDPATVVGPLAPTTSVYGPPAGFGISNSGGLPMPEGSGTPTVPRSGPASGMPGGVPGGAPRGGGMPGGGPGGMPGGGHHR